MWVYVEKRASGKNKVEGFGSEESAKVALARFLSGFAEATGGDTFREYYGSIEDILAQGRFEWGDGENVAYVDCMGLLRARKLKAELCGKP